MLFTGLSSNNGRSNKYLLEIVVIVVFVYCSYFLINFVSEIVINGFESALVARGSAAGILGTNSLIGTILLSAGLFEIYFSKYKFSRFIYIPVIIIIFVVSSSRVGVFLYLVFLIYSLVFLQKRKKTSLLSLLFLTILIMLMNHLGLFNYLIYRLEVTFDNSFSLSNILGERYFIIDGAYKIFLNNPFGIGFSAEKFNILLHQYYPNLPYFFEPNHSMTLFDFVYGGILFGVTVLTLSIILIVRFLRTKSKYVKIITFSFILYFLYGNINGTSLYSLNNGQNHRLYLFSVLFIILSHKISKHVGRIENESGR
ncbi:O-antigen ligase family protein [Candidatus Xianfuyuplasma coldseepsis]|uniref:O-antigen ligase-related domain-containing protein n=1 Tax=Candidatus Xianfuyuplasma coldseepsis TaxID=2782163 RepID=A0A7L7KQH2_9MOLU|nr:O-antigen ligase family protein [Xianfuyuplasma coldseepsis]QMS84532.1 hypothetical protein G4Z02_01810 [Xianfuyuplasma coldseepsis]